MPISFARPLMKPADGFQPVRQVVLSLSSILEPVISVIALDLDLPFLEPTMRQVNQLLTGRLQVHRE